MALSQQVIPGGCRPPPSSLFRLIGRRRSEQGHDPGGVVTCLPCRAAASGPLRCSAAGPGTGNPRCGHARRCGGAGHCTAAVPGLAHRSPSDRVAQPVRLPTIHPLRSDRHSPESSGLSLPAISKTDEGAYGTDSESIRKFISSGPIGVGNEPLSRPTEPASKYGSARLRMLVAVILEMTCPRLLSAP